MAVGHGDPPLRTSVGFLRCAKPVQRQRSALALESIRSVRFMNAVPERTPVPIHEGVLELEQALPLHFGGQLDNVRVAWRLVGDPAAPVIAALGGISAGRCVVNTGAERGWW